MMPTGAPTVNLMRGILTPDDKPGIESVNFEWSADGVADSMCY
ncbi:MAG: hypothetical protein ACI8RZ_006592 [Myxococcota bacterium]|jgi:hypothetical protein